MLSSTRSRLRPTARIPTVVCKSSCPIQICGVSTFCPRLVECAGCVTCASESKNAEKVRLGVCICVRPRPDCHFPIVKSKRIKKKILHYLICVATSRPELVFFLVFKTSVGTSGVACYYDCRHVGDDEESHHEDLDEGDHLHGHLDGTEDCQVMFCLFHCAACLHSGCSSVFIGVAASSSVGSYDLVLENAPLWCCALLCAYGMRRTPLREACLAWE